MGMTTYITSLNFIFNIFVQMHIFNEKLSGPFEYWYSAKWLYRRDIDIINNDFN